MTWVDVFATLIVCHLVGDFLIQTDWQASNKHGGLSDWTAFRALVSHVTTYTLVFVPALIWIGHHQSTGRALIVAAMVFVPHLIQDDGTLLTLYARHVKRNEHYNEILSLAIDQSFHVLVLFGVALFATS